MAKEVTIKQESIKQEATIRDFLNVIFRRKILIASIVCLTTILIFLLNYIQPQFYESNSRVLIKRGEKSSVFSSWIRALSWEEEVSSQIEVILSEAVFSRAREIFADSIAARGLPKEINFAPGAVRAAAIGESSVLAIRYAGFDPSLCQIGCAAVTQAYVEYYRTRKTPRELSDFFSDELQDIHSELTYWREKKREFLNREKYFGMKEESTFLLNILSNLELQVAQVRSEVSMHRLKVENLKVLSSLPAKELEQRLVISTGPQQILQSGIILNIKKNLQDLHIKEEELKIKYMGKHPEVIEVNRQIHDLQNALRQEVENSHKAEQSKLDELLAKQASMEKEIAKTRAAVDKVPDKESELNKINLQISILESKLEKLVSKQEEAIFATASNVEWDILVISPPSAAYQKKTRDYVRMAIGPFLSLIVALGLAFFLESLDHSVKNVAEVEEYLGMNVLATISEMHGRK